MKKLTESDFNKRITELKTDYLNDKRKYNWDYTFETQCHAGTYHIFFITNKMVSTVLKFDEEFGTIEQSNIGSNMIEQLIKMQKELENTPK